MKTLQSHALAVVGGIVLTLLAVWMLHGCDQPVVQIAQDGTPTALIPRADLRPKDVQPFVTSPTVSPLLNAVRAAGRTPLVVAETRGTVKVPVRDSGITNGTVFNNSIQPRFAEQPVEAVAVMSTDKSGQPTADLTVYQVQPDGTRQPLADAKTSIVAAQPQKPHWKLGLALQAGVGLTSDGAKGQAAAVIGLPWLRKSAGSAETTTWSLLTPALVTDGKTAQPAVLPFTYNVARFIPLLKDIHAGPVVSFDVTTQQPRLGLALAATF